MNKCSSEKMKRPWLLLRGRLTVQQQRTILRIVASAAILGLSFLLPAGILRRLCCLAAYLLIGWDILKEAGEGILRREPFDECLLMVLATIGAAVLGKDAEAVSVMLFFQIGELFEDIAVASSEKHISELMDIRPDYANLEQLNGSILRMDPAEVPVGSVIVVQPGERVPLDGVVLTGESSLDTSALTGESLPRDVEPDSQVCSGCINGSGVLRVQTTRGFGESTASRVMELVKNASERKTRSERFITRFSRIYTPCVIAAALLLAVLPPVCRAMADSPALWDVWTYRALTFLVISCPCALVISIPLTFFAGIGGAGRDGILIKGAEYLETLSQVKTVVFDKTGTMTEGVFEVMDIHHGSMEKEKLLELAALAECRSSHPISRSLIRACGATPDESRVTEIRERSGFGVLARVDEHTVAVGNAALMEKLGVSYLECRSAGTVVHVSVDGEYAGHILIADTLKPTAVETVAELKRMGVTRTVLLTGDRKSTAETAAFRLKVDEVHAELLPEDKVQELERLMARRKHGPVAALGDGINDAPLLTRADVGAAMGVLGSDAAIEAADVVLMDDDPMKFAVAVARAKRCMHIVRENVVFILWAKLVCMVMGALGYADLWLAVFADVGVMVLAVLNALRALGRERA